MKTVLLITLCFLCRISSFGQTDYDKQVEYFATDLSKKITGDKKKIAVVDFTNNDEAVTQFTRLVADDISSELAIVSNEGKRMEIVERNSLRTIVSDLKLSSSRDEARIAKELGKKAIADYLLTGTVTLFGDNYRISIKVLDTETGNIITASKGLVVKTAALESLHAKVLETKISNNNVSSGQTQQSNAVLQTPHVVNTVSTTGWIEFENKGNAYFILFVSEEIEVQSRSAKRFEKISIAQKSTENLPSLKPGVYYICACMGEYDAQCALSKKIEVFAGKGSKVIFQY